MWIFQLSNLRQGVFAGVYKAVGIACSVKGTSINATDCSIHCVLPLPCCFRDACQREHLLDVHVTPQVKRRGGTGVGEGLDRRCM